MLVLSRYVHRVALTNDRIEAFDQGRVTFRYIDSRTHQTRHLTFPVHAFISRFLQHVLPKGFQKIRGYGLFRPAATRQRQRARQLLELGPALPPPPKAPQQQPPATRPTSTVADSVPRVTTVIWSSDTPSTAQHRFHLAPR